MTTKNTKKVETPETSTAENYDFKTLERKYNENALIRIANTLKEIELRLEMIDFHLKRDKK